MIGVPPPPPRQSRIDNLCQRLAIRIKTMNDYAISFFIILFLTVLFVCPAVCFSSAGSSATWKAKSDMTSLAVSQCRKRCIANGFELAESTFLRDYKIDPECVCRRPQDG